MNCGKLFDISHPKKNGASIVLHQCELINRENKDAVFSSLNEQGFDIHELSDQEYSEIYNKDGDFSENLIDELKNGGKDIRFLLKYGDILDCHKISLYMRLMYINGFWTTKNVIELGNPYLEVYGMTLGQILTKNGKILFSVDELKQLGHVTSNQGQTILQDSIRHMDKSYVFNSNDGQDLGMKSSLACMLAHINNQEFSFDEIMSLKNPQITHSWDSSKSRTLANIVAKKRGIIFSDEQVSALGNPYDAWTEMFLSEQCHANRRYKDEVIQRIKDVKDIF